LFTWQTAKNRTPRLFGDFWHFSSFFQNVQKWVKKGRKKRQKTPFFTPLVLHQRLKPPSVSAKRPKPPQIRYLTGVASLHAP
jgi:hypothetical protein